MWSHLTLLCHYPAVHNHLQATCVAFHTFFAFYNWHLGFRQARKVKISNKKYVWKRSLLYWEIEKVLHHGSTYFKKGFQASNKQEIKKNKKLQQHLTTIATHFRAFQRCFYPNPLVVALQCTHESSYIVFALLWTAVALVVCFLCSTAIASSAFFPQSLFQKDCLQFSYSAWNSF